MFQRKEKLKTEEQNKDQLSMAQIILQDQASTILNIIREPKKFNGITSNKLYEYWLTYKYNCFSNGLFQITIEDHTYDELQFTAEALAEFVLDSLKDDSIDKIGLAMCVSSAMDTICSRYTELVILCKYLTANNLRVRKA